MLKIIEQPRHYCTLGAQQSVIAIKGAMPILHSGPGCGVKLFRGLSTDSGYQGTGYSGGGVIPCTNSTEKEVVFGGSKRLKEVIDGTLKVLKGDLFVVLTGCTSDIVGDDIGQIVGEYKKNGVPIVFAETGGFKGTNFKGHELVLKAIIDQFIGDRKPKIKKNLVNVFASVPFQDSFWVGNLSIIKHLLEGIGLEVNILFGPESGGVEELQTIPDAEFNIVASPWVGVETAKLLKQKYGTPYLHYAVPPIGAKETSKFLRSVKEFADLDNDVVENYIKKEEDKFYYYLERAADFFLEFRYSIPDRFFNITDSFYALGISQFLLNELGIVPGEQYITDDVPKKYQEYIIEKFNSLSDTRDFKVFFEVDSGKIHQRLREYDVGTHIPLILGSSWDRDIADEINAFKINISIPIMHRLVLNGGYLGYNGGMRLIEDIYGNILETYK
ncbi:nitrogenase component 1 [Clostridium tyrobutyricum]|jgi:nitrogenase molybdenum-iron protein beta chain|uniref:nitrogenase component 1 n=1 Tax=Clostridium tyrobutyricum TaxID=1519 RepID=UPI00057F49CA|nr:nitrogenase component 1 [Clostridium tyrobutyricum]MBR9647664.1 hydrogenase [Clostridium tyrobutyricum]QCH29138.1 Nitrogenase molybdenum-iron protein beta chain [Clostridium tyrobutyricum]